MCVKFTTSFPFQIKGKLNVFQGLLAIFLMGMIIFLDKSCTTKGAGSLVQGIFKGIYIVKLSTLLYVEAARAKCACFNRLFDKQGTCKAPGCANYHLYTFILKTLIYIYLCVCETVHYFISV